MNARLIAAGCAAFITLAVQSAMALTIDYSYSAIPNPASWGTMNIDVVNSNTLSVLYTAASPLPAGTQATGFAFSFAGELVSPSVSNAVASPYNNPNLNWVRYIHPNGGMGNLPGLANAQDFTPSLPTQYLFEMAATEQHPNAQTMNPPGITAGTSDIFLLQFAQNYFTPNFDLASFVELTAVRLQGFETYNTAGEEVSSLLLAGKEENQPVPEPGTVLLLGAGLAGLAIYSKRRRN